MIPKRQREQMLQGKSLSAVVVKTETRQTVAEILQEKGRQVWTIGPQQSVFEALRVLGEHEIGALVVVKEAEVVGLFSERDYAREVILQGKSSKDTRIEEIMRSPAVTVEPDYGIGEVMALMTFLRLRHMPVMEGDDLVGLVSMGDLVKAIIDEQGQTIEHLHHFITGRYPR